MANIADNVSRQVPPPHLAQVTPEKTEGAAEPPVLLQPVSFAVLGLFILSCFYTLYFTRELTIPIAAALVLFVTLTPIVRRLARRGIPAPLSSAAIVFGLFAIVTLGIYALSDPISDWRQRAPSIMSEIEYKLHGLKKSVEEVQKASEQVEKIAGDVAGGTAKTQEVVVKSPSLLQRFFGGLQALDVQLGITLVLFYFTLASACRSVRAFILLACQVSSFRARWPAS